MATQTIENRELDGVSPLVLALQMELASQSLVRRATFDLGDLDGKVLEGRDS
jgi:hypothetical protein